MVCEERAKAFAVIMLLGLCVTLAATRLVAAARFNAVPPGRSSSADRAEALLEKARAALGGTGALDDVKSLILRRHDKTTIKILFPDRLQTIDSTPWGDAINTLDGDRVWVRMPKLPDRFAAPSATIEAGTSAVAQAARRHQIVECSLKYLLRPPVGYRMSNRYAGKVTFGSTTGEAVEFAGPDDYWVSMIFDASTGLPKAQVRRIVGNPQVNGTHLIQELRDYRRSGDILLPFEIAEYRLRLGRTEAMAVWKFAIEVNPPLKEADFREPSAR
jgi:hypothetical protein